MTWTAENMTMGFEGIAKIGTAGATATNVLTNCRDISESFEPAKGDTTVRGNSDKPPVGTESVSRINYSLELTMVNDKTDTQLADMKQAAADGTAIAIRTLDHANGKGVDADFTLSMSKPMNLDGEQVISFTCTPNRGHGREPELYV